MQQVRVSLEAFGNAADDVPSVLPVKACRSGNVSVLQLELSGGVVSPASMGGCAFARTCA